jgi:hypothetical protein
VLIVTSRRFGSLSETFYMQRNVPFLPGGNDGFVEQFTYDGVTVCRYAYSRASLC